MDILLKIKLLLESKNQTVSAVAKELNVNRNTLYSWGVSTYPKVDLLVKLAKIYNVPMSYFFDETAVNHSVAKGQGSASSVYGNATAGALVDKDKEIEHLKAMIEEKERTIQILMGKK
jgi:transcriptional regulator with XRE-family HTH domain